MTTRRPHLSDESLSQRLAPGAFSDAERAHLETCAECRRRVDELERLHALMRVQARLAIEPRRDLVPGAVKRLRLRNHGVVNANELLNLFVAFVRGIGSLFAVDDARRNDCATRPANDDAR